MHEDVHDVQVDLQSPGVVGLVGQQDKLDAQQWDEDERSPYCPHVEAGFSLVGHPQLGDEHTHNIEQEEEVHLEGKQVDSGQPGGQRVRFVKVIDNYG